MTLAGHVTCSLAATMGLTQAGIEVGCFAGPRTLAGTGAGARFTAGSSTWTGDGAAGQGTRVSSSGDVHPGCVQDIFQFLSEDRNHSPH